MKPLMLMSVLLLASCGYTTRSLMPGEVSNLAVDIFGNDTFEREIEFTLTRELTRELNQRAALRLTRRRHADAVLTGRIVRVSYPTLVETTNNEVSEQAVLVEAVVELKRLSDNSVISRFKIGNRAEFVVERGESRQTAFEEALRDLAEDIVNELERRSFYRDLEAVRRTSSEGSE